ncbi:MAG: type transport system permease protein [Clostridiales bacterium]|jgi:ABC-2 type transport system permease protein|nr:type transport system permease protein [Clostridiales bacterium]
MRKFANLLKKEVKELITFQLIVSLLFTIGMFYFIGNIVQSEVQKAEEKRDIHVFNLDDSQESKALLDGLSYAGFKVNLLEKKDKAEAIEYAKNSNISLLIVIPEGFSEAASKFQFKEIEAYSFIRSFSMTSSANAAIVDQVISEINKLLSNNFLKKNFPDLNPEDIKNPIKSKDFVVVKDIMAEGSAAEVSNIVYSQSIFIPVILMMIIVFSSQMVLSAMAMEKQDKTLETLLTVPISRNQIVIAKMAASALVGLISAGVYMLGFRYYMGGFMGNIQESGQLNELMQKLGLQFNSGDYVVLGISIFLAILCALGLTIILGVMVEDLKSAQTMILPLIFLVMIPYFISLFSDINSLSLPVKILIMLIPFSHPFIASQNILLGNYAVVFYGILYMLAVFIILIFICGRIFSTDRVLTMKLRFGKKGFAKNS